ncbi:uncharacterized protein LOC115922216 [Strongylocentrotus purpuratus]|uniref:Cyclic nucleotide-binding domain-containing protein n=1 Tax=Strongylocentrotus purpuratus TaxID=7668 RepID=A0A7M7NH15_STRPU|nr:uncharacterized protein LOC115922216 [Strongylocentrotus purpuratus]
MVAIGNRITEVHDMVTPRNTKEITMNRLQTPLKNKVRELSIMTPGTFRRNRRPAVEKKFDAAHCFFNAIKSVLIVVTIYRRRRRYVQRGSIRDSFDSEIRCEDYNQVWFSTQDKESADTTPQKTVIGNDYQCDLRMQPKHRTQEQLERIALKIRTIKKFQMFPTKIEEELCRTISYGCYDDGRVIAYQGSTSRRFYYIISGQIGLLHTYKLQSGEVTKPVGVHKSGYSTPREELERRLPLTSNMVCKGNVEVLILEIEDFLYLIDPPDDPPIDFLREQSMFRDFPVDEFRQYPDSIRSKYYPPNKVICEDANHTKWLYLVMSGECCYLRKQNIPKTANLSNRPLVGGGPLGEDIRQRRPSHANEMIEMSLARYVAKQRTTLPYLPEIRTSIAEDAGPTTNNPHGQSIGLPPISREDTRSISPSSRRASTVSYNHDLPALARHNDIVEDPLLSSENRSRSRQRRNSMFLTERSRTDASISRAQTRQRTQTFPLGGRGARGRRQKRVFLRLGKLQQGDIFGLNEVAETLQVESSGVSVVSGGSEVIAISKRFFRQHAGVMTLLKLESMLQEFVSEEGAKDILREEKTWKRYKEALVSKVATKKAERSSRDRRGIRVKLNPLAQTL